MNVLEILRMGSYLKVALVALEGASGTDESVPALPGSKP